MFKQLIEVMTSDPDALVAHVNGYDASSARRRRSDHGS